MNDRGATPEARRDPLEDIASQARDWLFDAAAVLWRASPDGETPLFPERLSVRGEKDVCPHRLFVQARALSK